MRYLLDTNAWLRWFHRPQEISTTVRQLLNAEQVVALSPMSIIEVAQKADKGKLILPLPVNVWVRQSLPAGRIKLLPISVEVALAAYTWPPDFHGDPADRIIAATANVHRLTLVTSDDKLLARSDLKTLSTH
ncbi:MAG: type II toxin-antitoxin system VapC family toxin [Verrucomicrobia bacterium]|nr:type II toxin-antitoxin system VapC family toxin [Verrucomicrobiota bacterium]